MLINTALLCLSMNIYMEARGEPVMGQYAVAMVTLNRAKQDPDKVCHETFKPKQFSWTTKLATKTSMGWKIPKPKDAHAWWMATRIAETSLAGKMPDFTQGAKFYHATYVQPRWAASMTVQRRVGAHIFYTAAS